MLTYWIPLFALVGAVILFVRKVLITLIERDDETAVKGLSDYMKSHENPNFKGAASQSKKEPTEPT